ncbi:MAG: TonB-dependent receptor [Noviherbaspirillum sp.]
MDITDRCFRLAGPAGAALLFAGSAWCANIPAGKALADLSLEELANIQITTVSKRPESLADAPASVFVITGEEIRRSGAATLPEAMRLAPNLQVARVDARNYAVTARGFNSPFANKLLVLIDGRAIYSPLFSGVFWDAQDVVLEDISRIEVISGPGATVWGANAVNGVINIITKSARDTQGTLASAGIGNNDKSGVLRYGGALDGGHYRVYGKVAEGDDSRNAAGTALPTGWRRRQAGFRSDWSDPAQQVTLQGDIYRGALHQAGTADIDIGGANLNGRISRALGSGSSISAQAYLDYTERKQPNAFVEYLHTLDTQAQHSLKLGDGHQMVWGGGYRVAFDHVRNENAFGFLPGAKTLHWGNIFVQDEIDLPRNVRLTAGLKLEHNSYTGAELLPTLRLAWKPVPEQLLWASASRAVRTPSRIDRDLYSPTRPRVVNGVPQFALAGGPDFQSEVANVLELGYRAQPSPTLSWSATLFASRYDRLRTLEPNSAGPGAAFANQATGSAQGLEAWATWQPAPAWRLSAGGVTQRVRTALMPASRDASGATGLAPGDPSNHWMLRSSYDIAPGQELDFTVRHNAALRAPAVPAYTTVDMRYGWQIQRNLELSIAAQNLLNRAHTEFGAGAGASVYERSIFVRLAWRS